MNETQTVSSRKPLTLTLVFFAGFILCLLICNLMAPEMHHFTTTDLSQLYLFLYANLPCAIVKLLALANYSAFGIIFSLVASFFFLVIGVLLYCCPVGEKCSDEAEPGQADSLARRLLHYFCCFPFLQMVCLATAHIAFGQKYVLEHKIYCFVAPLLFLLFTVIEFFTAQSKAQKWKSVCRLLASVSVTLGIAGLAGRIGDHGLASLVLPVSIRQLLIQIAEFCGSGFWGILFMILIMVGCSSALVACVIMMIKAGEDFYFSYISTSFHLLILFIISFFSPYFSAAWAETVFDADHFSYWLLMLVSITVLAVFCGRSSRRNGIKFWLGGIGAFTFLPATLDSIRAFSGNISGVLSRLTLWGNGIEENIYNLILRYCPEDHWSFIVFLIVLLVIVVGLFVLLYMPLLKIREENAYKIRQYDHEFLSLPQTPGICSLVFLFGYELCCLRHSVLDLPWIELAGYYPCAFAAITFCIGLVGCIFLRYRVSVGYYLYALGVTVFWTLLLTFCAHMVASVVCAIAISIGIGAFFLGGISELGNRNKSTVQYERFKNKADGYALLAEIAEMERTGQISSSEARIRTMEVKRAMAQNDEILSEELETME